MKLRSRRSASPAGTPSGHAEFSGAAFFRCKPLALGVAACFAVASADMALALPVNPAVVAGQASFAQSGGTLTVTNKAGTIINWQGFSIGVSELTRFVQPSASSAVLNRVTGAESSTILGTLQSNGRVFLLNPNGIVFGKGSVVDVAGLVASSLDMSNADFLGGRLAFTAGAVAGSVLNQGAITTPTGGNVYLIAPDVQNSGIITSPKGEVVLAAGKSVQLVDIGTPDLRVEITAPGNEAVNLGEIAAQAGRVGIAGTLVRNSGTLNASSAVEEGGRVFLRASQDTYVDGAGRIVATGTKGGRVEVLGNRVAVMDNAGIDASGTNGGGTVLVGGDYQGKNPDVQNAQVTYFGPNASIRADAEKVGDGGTVIVWADGTTRAYGSISARGGAEGGNGGFVETSGKQYLDFHAKVDTRAPKGKAGMLLLDPDSITIVGGSGDGAPDGSTTSFYGSESITPGSIFYNDTGPSIVYESELEGIGTTSPIVLQANNSISTSGSFVDNDVTVTSDLFLSTDNISGGGFIDLTSGGTNPTLAFKSTFGSIHIMTGTSATPQPASITVGQLTSGTTNPASVLLSASGDITVMTGISAPTTQISVIVNKDNGLFTSTGATLAGPYVSLTADRMALGSVAITPYEGESLSIAAFTPGRDVRIGADDVDALTGAGGMLGLTAGEIAGITSTSPYSSVMIAAQGTGAVLRVAGATTFDASIPQVFLSGYGGLVQSAFADLSVPGGSLNLMASYGGMTLAAANTAYGAVMVNLPQADALLDASGGSIVSDYGMVDIHADRITLGPGGIWVPDGGFVDIGPWTPGRHVSLGGADSGTQLGLDANEISYIKALDYSTYGGATVQIGPIDGGAQNISIDAPVAFDSSIKTLYLYTPYGSVTQTAGSTLAANNLQLYVPMGDVLLPENNDIDSLTAPSAFAGKVQFRSVAPTVTITDPIVTYVAGLPVGTPAIDISTPNDLVLTQGNLSSSVSGGIRLQAANINVNNSAMQGSISAYGDVALLTPVGSGSIFYGGGLGTDIFSSFGAITLEGLTINTGGSVAAASDVNINFDGNLSIINTITSLTKVNIHVYYGGGTLYGGLPGTVSGAPNPSQAGTLTNAMSPGLINIAAPKVVLMADSDIGASGNPITTQTAQLTARSYGGSVWIDNTGSLQLIGVNGATGTFGLKATGANAGITLAGVGNSLAAGWGLFQADGAISLMGMNVGYFSAKSVGGDVLAYNLSSMSVVTGGTWTDDYALYAGGTNPGGRSIDVNVGFGNQLYLDDGADIVGAAGSEILLAGGSITGSEGFSTIGGAAKLSFTADDFNFGDPGITSITIPHVNFAPLSPSRPMALYSTTQPAAICSTTLCIDLAGLKTAASGVTRLGFAAGNISLYDDLMAATLPTGLTDLGLAALGGTLNANGRSIVVPNLFLATGGNLTLAAGVDHLAADIGGSFTFTNSKALTLHGVDAGGAVAITAAGSLDNSAAPLPFPEAPAAGIRTLNSPVALTATSGDITNGGGINSGGGAVNLTASAGNIINNAPGISSLGGNVKLSAGGNISTALIDAGAGSVNLVAYGGGVSDLDGVAPNIVAGALTLDVAGISDFGTQVGTLSGSTHGNNLKLAQNGSLGLAGLDLGAGNLDLTVYGGALSGPATGVGLTGNAVRLVADSIDLNTDVSAMDATAASYINVTSGRSLSFAGSSGGDITVRTVAPVGGVSDITLGLVKALNKKVTVDAAGRIIDGNDTATPVLNIEAAALDLKSMGGIGVGNPLETKVSGITLLNGNGNVELANQGVLTLGPITLNGTGDFKLDNVGKVETKAPIDVYGGGASIQAHSPIIIGAALTASGDIVLLTTDDGTPGDTITINGVLKSLSGGITVNANDSILQNANILTGGAGPVQLKSAAGGIVMVSGTSITTVGGIIDLAASGNITLSLLDTGGVSGTVNVTSTAGSIGSSITGNNINTRTLLMSASTGISNVAFKATAVNLSTDSGFVTVIDSNTGTVFSDDPAFNPPPPLIPVEVVDEVQQQIDQQISTSTLSASDSLVPGEGENSVTTLGLLDSDGGGGKKDEEDEDKKKKGDEKKTDEGKTDEKPKKAALPVCR
jgi:filamentous hemagglutinin family protein